jgi:hypothetical protein
MLDFSHIPVNNRTKFDVFYGMGGTAAAQWVTWTKPRGISSLYIMCIGGGGGGSNGAVGGASQSGGIGGGSGGVTTALYNSSLLPDTLYISPAYVSDVGATAGGNTYVSVYPSTANNAYLVCWARGATAGGTGASAVTGNSMPLASYGFFSALAGQTGGTGGAGAAGTSITWGVNIVSGGAGGGGKTNASGFAGGNITGAGPMPTITGGAATASGLRGLNFTIPFMFSGGSGGGGTTGAGAGTTGGDGGIGSGGGGGGGAGSGTAQTGGRGGPGLVAIWGF